MAQQLFDSQEQYLERLGDKPFLFAGTGAGKTRMSMYRAERLGASKVLVITTATVRDTHQWEKELDKIELEFDEFEVQSHAWLQKKRDWSAYSDHYIIIDEAHKIKNSTSKQGQGGYALCLASNWGYSLLSATPMSNWSDAVNYAKITGLVRNKTEFYRRFVIEQPSYAHRGKDIIGYKDTDVLEFWWNSISERGRPEDFVDLPKKQMIPVDIKINRKGYIDMIKTRMRGDEPLDSAPKLNWALRQYAETAPEKLNWCVDAIDGMENCIVFCNTIAAIEMLGDKLKSAGVDYGVWYGAKKDKFTDKRVMLVQYQSGGTGLNLQAFNNTIFLSPCYSFTDYHQAVGRTHRTGQEKRCTFYHLRAENTIDKAIWDALKEKRDFDDKLNVEEM